MESFPMPHSLKISQPTNKIENDRISEDELRAFSSTFRASAQCTHSLRNGHGNTIPMPIGAPGVGMHVVTWVRIQEQERGDTDVGPVPGLIAAVNVKVGYIQLAALDLQLAFHYWRQGILLFPRK
ncbi:unnamed protein product [Dovyalis caffra]|uniref:Uncharacterized protein n=1 Tax=Dovyalis caffra TaxID=77055 RepID=A0AAV1RCR6_9ROSI|nr:unnamed protein product [Dovyalis caffra]